MINTKHLTAASVLIGLLTLLVYNPWLKEVFDHLLIEKTFIGDRDTEIVNMTVAQVMKIAQNALLKAPNGPETTFGEVWKERRTVIVFFRRFG